MATENAKVEATETNEHKARSRSWIVVVVLMVLEGVAIFAGTKLLFNPAPATVDAGETQGEHGEAAHGGQAPSTQEFAEVELTECRPVNRVSGKLITFRMRVSLLVRSSNSERVKTLVEGNKARINDRVNFVIRSAEPSHLNEPALETIKRRLKSELDRILGDETLIHDVLIPEMLPSGPGL
jgi:flagellar basal body-associated protein FliL